jgi:hypothetical protein
VDLSHGGNMANEIKYRHNATAKTLYATIRSQAGTMWSTAGTPALEALTVANWANYKIALTETPSGSYFYVGTWPTGLTTTGAYWVDVFDQAGAAAAISDTLVGTLLGYWNATTFTISLPSTDDMVAALEAVATTLDHVYTADVTMTVDRVNVQDEYSVLWYKDGVRLTTGITSPLLQVVKRADGTDLIAEISMTVVGTDTGAYSYDATGSSRRSAGEAVLVLASATIDGTKRTTGRWLSRDS